MTEEKDTKLEIPNSAEDSGDRESSEHIVDREGLKKMKKYDRLIGKFGCDVDV